MITDEQYKFLEKRVSELENKIASLSRHLSAARMREETASITDTFDKQTPVKIIDADWRDLPEEKQVKKGEEQEFYIRIPLAQLDSNRPTHVACRISVLVGTKKEERDIDVSFSISW